MIPRLQDSARHRSAGRAAAQLLVSFLALSTTPAASGRNTQEVLSPILDPLIPQNPTDPAQHTFTLRHIFHHGADLYPKLHRKKDIKSPKEKVLWLAAEDGHDALQLPPLIARSQPIKIERMVDRRPSVVDPMVAAARKGGYVWSMAPSAWNLDDVQGPDVTDKDTVLSMAYMCSNAYARDGEDPDWHEVGGPFNNSADFGWEGDGLRGHIWADENNSTIVIGLKGTSPAYFDGKETTTNDKVNDNLFFGCCCGQQGAWTYRQVCDCATGTYTCNNTCVRSALQEENRYYTAARELYSNVTELYPNSNIWVAGHSLGGAVSSLLGLTYGLPVVTFEAVPEALPASRLGLPVPPSADPNFPQERQYTGTYHFGHTADPIYIGTCSGSTASCSYFGYALESACHTGYECTYDVVADKGWRVGIGTHQILSVIRDVILQYDTVPECKPTPECRDCHKWKFYWSNGSEITTTSSTSPTSTMTRTRTSTCKTPGWWGCLDEDTTTGTETATTSTSTSTCQTPGWFGCKDKTTTTTTTTSETTTTTATTTCETPRWWGCNDKTTVETSTTGTLTTEPTVEPTITSPPTLTSELPTPTTMTTTSASRCLHRNWYGRCTRWEGDGPEPEPEPPADPPVNNARPDEI